MIDDASHGHNQTLETEEQIHTTSASAAAAVGCRFRALLGKRLRKRNAMRSSSKDMKGAYKQIGVHESQLRCVVIAIYDPISGSWRFAVSYALPFGLVGAVLHFNRVPTMLTAFLRRWFAIPVQHFFDDFRIIEPDFTNGSGFSMFQKVVDLLGWRFDPEKDQPPLEVAPMLGCLEDWSFVGAGLFHCSCKPERLADIA